MKLEIDQQAAQIMSLALRIVHDKLGGFIKQLEAPETEEPKAKASHLKQIMAEAGNLLACPKCGATHSKGRKPFLKPIQLDRHMYTTHTKKGRKQIRLSLGRPRKARAKKELTETKEEATA